MKIQYEREIRQTQRMLESLLLPRSIKDFLGASISTTEAKLLLEQYAPKEYVARLGLNNEIFQRATGLVNNKEAMLKAAGLDSNSKITKYYEQHKRPSYKEEEFLEILRRQAFGGISAVDFARELQEANPAFRAIEAAKKSLDELWPNFRDIDFSQFELSEEDEHETKQAAETITQKAIQQESLQAVVEFIVLAIQAEQKPTVQLMLWLSFKKLMDWLIAGLIGAAISHCVPLDSPQAAKKAVLADARAKVGSPQLLEEYRYISAKLLIVRQNPRASSPEIGRLSFGKAVKLQSKNKDFALVLWTDEKDGAEIKGWVFSRYLGKFN